MTPISLSDLEALERAALKGSWFYDSYAKVFSTESDENAEWDFYIAHIPCRTGDGTASPQGRANAEFIAASRNALPELIASLRIAVEALKKLEGWEMLYRLEGGLSYPPGSPKQISETISAPAREALTEIRKLVSIE